jgi:integrase
MLEVAYTYGWRASELLNMRVSQIDLSSRSIYLNPGETKNDDARMVVMTPAVYELVKALVIGKKPDDYVFTRDDGKPVPRFFHSVWRTVCIRAGVGHWVCRNCGQKLKVRWCGQCSEKKLVTGRVSYQRLLFHDLRRSGARNLRRAGIAEDVIMKIGGWRTRSVFSRYNIVSHNDIRDAVQKLERARREWGTVSATVSVAQEEGQSSAEAKAPLPN